MNKKYLLLASPIYNKHDIYIYKGDSTWEELELEDFSVCKTYNIFDIKKIINIDKEHEDDKWTYTIIEANTMQTI